MSPTTPEHRYELILHGSDGDDSYTVEVPELPGYAADGATKERSEHRVRRRRVDCYRSRARRQ